MTGWLPYAIGAAVLYGLHQVFTKLASASASDAIGGFVVEASAAFTIALYLVFLWARGPWKQHADLRGVLYSLATGLCVGAGTILFFQMFQRGAPLSSVPIVLAVGSGIMVLAGVVIFHDALGWRHWIGVLLALGAILLLRST